MSPVISCPSPICLSNVATAASNWLSFPVYDSPTGRVTVHVDRCAARAPYLLAISHHSRATERQFAGSFHQRACTFHVKMIHPAVGSPTTFPTLQRAIPLGEIFRVGQRMLIGDEHSRTLQRERCPVAYCAPAPSLNHGSVNLHDTRDAHNTSIAYAFT